MYGILLIKYLAYALEAFLHFSILFSMFIKELAKVKFTCETADLPDNFHYAPP